MRRIGVVTVARSDYGIYRPLLHFCQRAPDLDLGLYVSGAHLAPQFGNTVDEIEADGFPIRARIDMQIGSDTAQGISSSTGQGILGLAALLEAML